MSVTYRKFSKRQLLAMTWWNQPGLKDRDALICDGSVRSGKSLSMTCGFFLWSMTCFQNQVFALCGKTVSALRRNLIIHLGDWLGDLFEISENRSENKLTLRLNNRVNTYYLFGGQDESSYALIQGITLAGVLLDEVVLMPRSFVEQACARCSVEGSKMWFNCNPGSREHWFFRQWMEKLQQKNALHLHFTMEDNPGLSQAVRQRYNRMYTGIFYNRYILGQWCRAEGLIYDFDPNKHICTQPPKAGRYYISVDYGTQNPFSAGLWCVEDNKAVRLREYYHDGRKQGSRTDEEYYQALEDLAGEMPVEAVIIDPSAASLITLIRRRGRFRVRRGDNRVLPGIRLVGSLLQQGKLLICPQCTDTIREFGLYAWEEGRDAPKKEYDHAMDDIRYFAMTVMKHS